MLNGLRLLARYAQANVRGEMTYRASFLMYAVGSFLSTGMEFLGIWALFARFESLQGWRLAEVALFYGLVSTAFALAETAAAGFDRFHVLIRMGEFDRLLLRPRPTALQVAGEHLPLHHLGRLLQGLAVLTWAATALDIAWSPPRVLLALITVGGGGCLFAGIFVIQGTLTFWTTESLEIVNTMSYGGVETGQYPITLYRDWFRKFFTFIVPLACVTYFPAVAILGRQDPLGSSRLLQWLAPLVGVLFLVVALQLWRIGVRKYRSTGS
jgi:ABC-2 type transport system permease protein